MSVAHHLGDLLGYRVVGDDLPKIAALRLGTSHEDVVAVEHRAPSLAERILHNLGSSGHESHAAIVAPSFESEVRKEIEAAVLEAAEEANVIIVGGIANVILHGRPHLLSVFLHAPMDYRVRHVMESLDLDAEKARKEIARVDAARRRWAKVHYDLVWGRAEYYALTIDVSQFGIDGTARLIADAVRQAEG